METHKKCCFIGHRDVEITQELKERIKNSVENLIINENVKVYLFGSKSDFNNLCHIVVTELKEKYPDIKRIGYTCRSEAIILESERDELEKFFSYLQKREVHLKGYEEEFEHKTKYTSGKASYIERNQAMIDDSDYCLFYYDENYLPPTRKYSKRSVGCYQPNSGTAAAYQYAKQKNKIIINFK